MSLHPFFAKMASKPKTPPAPAPAPSFLPTEEIQAQLDALTAELRKPVARNHRRLLDDLRRTPVPLSFLQKDEADFLNALSKNLR